MERSGYNSDVSDKQWKDFKSTFPNFQLVEPTFVNGNHESS